jgi:hypothetical protein
MIGFELKKSSSSVYKVYKIKYINMYTPDMLNLGKEFIYLFITTYKLFVYLFIY